MSPKRAMSSPLAPPTPRAWNSSPARADSCHGTGYRGPVQTCELFMITGEARGLVLAKRSTGEVRRHAIERGMVTLQDDGWPRRGRITTDEESLRVPQEDRRTILSTPSAVDGPLYSLVRS